MFLKRLGNKKAGASAVDENKLANAARDGALLQNEPVIVYNVLYARLGPHRAVKYPPNDLSASGRLQRPQGRAMQVCVACYD